jgi:hypothetical protein
MKFNGESGVDGHAAIENGRGSSLSGETSRAVAPARVTLREPHSRNQPALSANRRVPVRAPGTYQHGCIAARRDTCRKNGATAGRDRHTL